MRRDRLLALIVALAALGLIVFGHTRLWATLIAAAAAYAIFRLGFGVIGSFARPVPGPPPPGELRKVRIQFRCALCGTEVRMTVANDEIPDPPRHCLEDMELMAPILE